MSEIAPTPADPGVPEKVPTSDVIPQWSSLRTIHRALCYGAPRTGLADDFRGLLRVGPGDLPHRPSRATPHATTVTNKAFDNLDQAASMMLHGQECPFDSFGLCLETKSYPW